MLWVPTGFSPGHINQPPLTGFILGKVNTPAMLADSLHCFECHGSERFQSSGIRFHREDRKLPAPVFGNAESALERLLRPVEVVSLHAVLIGEEPPLSTDRQSTESGEGMADVEIFAEHPAACGVRNVLQRVVFKCSPQAHRQICFGIRPVGLLAAMLCRRPCKVMRPPGGDSVAKLSRHPFHTNPASQRRAKIVVSQNADSRA